MNEFIIILIAIVLSVLFLAPFYKARQNQIKRNDARGIPTAPLCLLLICMFMSGCVTMTDEDLRQFDIDIYYECYDDGYNGGIECYTKSDLE